MKCRACGKEIQDDAKFCSFCGASQQEKVKLTWGEKRRLRQKETEEILKKASLTEQDIINAKKADVEGLKLSYVGELSKEANKAVVMCVVYALATLIALAGIVLMQYVVDINKTLRALISFVILLFLAGFGASFADRLYCARVFNKMKKSERAIKKISYGKAPYLSDKGKLYRIICCSICEECGATMHIEEFKGQLVAVCDKDREHLGIIDNEKIFEKLQ